MIYRINPDNFSPAGEKVGCLIEVESYREFVMLLRKDSRLWELPTTALQPPESPLEAVVRNVKLEIGLKKITETPQLVKSFQVRTKEDFVYHLYQMGLIHQPEIKLGSEYERARWVSVREAYNLPIPSELVHYLRTCYKL